jgi:hypothetical protein
LSDIGWLAQGRVEGMAADAYILQSIVDPNVYLAPECPNGPCLANIMPRDYGQRLTSEQQEIMVSYLLEQQMPPGQVEVVEAPESSEPAPKAFPAAKQPVHTTNGRNVTAVRLASILLLTLVFLVSLLIYFRGAPDDSGGEN